MSRVSRRTFTQTTGVAGASLFSGPISMASADGNNPVRKPNILFINTDQHRYDCVGINDNDVIQTPTLDRLAREGTNCSHFFVNAPVCMASRACMWTGRYCSNHGSRNNGVSLPRNEITLAHTLSEHGYYTANIGKLHFLPHATRDHTLPHPSYGFTHHENSDEPGCYPDAYIRWIRNVAPEWESKAGVPNPWPNGRNDFVTWTFEPPEELHQCAWTADRTIATIRNVQRTDKPWMISAGFYLPHAPLNPPQRFLNLYDPESIPKAHRRDGEHDDKPRGYIKARNPIRSDEEIQTFRHHYYACVSLVDYHVGRIIAELERTSELDNTLIVFWSDHGEAMGDHDRWYKFDWNTDEVIRVPTFVRWPGHIPQGQTCDAMMETVDIMPTLLDAAGIDTPKGVKGTSMWDTLRGKSNAGKESILVESGTNEGSQSAWDRNAGRCNKTIRTRDLLYWRDHRGGEVLYDLERDPHEFETVRKSRNTKSGCMKCASGLSTPC